MVATRAWSFPAYRAIWTGTLLNQIGTWTFQIAVVDYAIRGGATATQLGLLVAVVLAPVSFLGPLAGAIADTRGAVGPILLGAATGVVGSLVVLWLVMSDAGLVAIGASSVLIGISVAVDGPARVRLTVESVGFDHLKDALAMGGLLFNSGRFLGPIVGGLAIAVGGVRLALIVNAVSYIGSIAGTLYAVRHKALDLPLAIRQKRQVREGIGYVRSRPRLWIPLLGFLVMSLFTLNYLAFLPLVANELSEDVARGTSLLLGSIGLGAMIGNAAVLFWSRAPSSPVLGAVIVAVANFPLAVAPLSEALAIGCLVICGVGMGLFFPSFQASLQVAAEPAMQGRVSAIFFAANFGTDPIAALIVTAVVAFAGVSLGFGFAAAGGLAAALAVASQLNDRSEVDGDGQLARV